MSSIQVGDSVSKTTELLSGYYDVLLNDPRIRRALPPSDRAFFRGMSLFATGIATYNDIRDDIRNGMDPWKAIFVNVVAAGAGYSTMQGSLKLGSFLVGTKAFAPLGVVVLGTSPFIAGKAHDSMKSIAEDAYDELGDSLFRAIKTIGNSSIDNDGATVTILDCTGGSASIDYAVEVVKQLSLKASVTQIKVYNLTSEGTYIVQPGDALLRIAKEFNKDVNELASANGIEIVSRPDGSTFAMLKPGQVIVVNASTSLRVVTKYEYDSIKAMYDDSSTEDFGLNIVTTAAYNDWKRDAAIAAFNLFGQPAIQQLAPLSLLSPDVQSSINAIHSSMSDKILFSALAA